MKKYASILPLLLVAILYLPFLGNAFLSDDIPGITQSLPHFSWGMAFQYLARLEVGWFIQFVTYKIFGMTPITFRFLNIAAHAGSAFLLYAIVKKLVSPRVALVACLLFAVHPIMAESVVWISGGWYSWSTTAFLLSFWLYLTSRERGKTGMFILSLLFFVLSFLISSKTVTLSFIYLASEWSRGTLRKNWKRVIPYIVLSFAFALFLASRVPERIETQTAESYQSLSELYNPIYQVPYAVTSYFELIVWPANLTLYHAGTPMSIPEYIVRAVMMALYLFATVYALVKRRPIGFWLAWFLIALAVVLTPLKINWIFAERYAYLASIGIYVSLAIAFDWVVSYTKFKSIVYLVGIVLVIALATRTVVRNSEWRNEETLWISTVRHSPEVQNSWNNIGNLYSRRKDYEKAREAFSNAIQINPNYADAYHNLGNVLFLMGHKQEAVAHYEKALSINPKLWQSRRQLAYIAMDLNDYNTAIRLLWESIGTNPDVVELYIDLGSIYVFIGEKERARDMLERARTIDPGNPSLLILQGSLSR